MRNRKFILLISILFLFEGRFTVFARDSAVDPREAAIDRAIGGMVEGSRPLSPQNYAGKNQAHKVPGGRLSPSTDTRVTASAGSANQETASGGDIAGTAVGGAAEPASGGSASDGIVNVDANVNLSGGEPAVDANTSTTTDMTSTDTTVAESGAVAGEDLATTVNDAPLDATLDGEIVATDVPVDSEVSAGLEADVDPVTADSDVTSVDPVDALVI